MPSGHIFFCYSRGTIGQDAHIFIPFVARHSPKAKLRKSFCYTSQKQGRIGHLLPVTRKIKDLCRFRYGCSTEDIKLQLLKESAIHTIIIRNDKIKLKTAFGRLSHIFLRRILTGFVKGAHSFQLNRKKGPRH